MARNKTTAKAPFIATKGNKISKKQKDANVSAGFLPNGQKRKRATVRNVLTLEQIIARDEAKLAVNKDRLLVRAFADDDTVKRCTLALSSLRALAKHDHFNAIEVIGAIGSVRDDRIAKLRQSTSK